MQNGVITASTHHITILYCGTITSLCKHTARVVQENDSIRFVVVCAHAVLKGMQNKYKHANMRRIDTWHHLLGKSHTSGGYSLCSTYSYWGNKFCAHATDAPAMMAVMTIMTMLLWQIRTVIELDSESVHPICEPQQHISAQMTAVSVCLVTVCRLYMLFPRARLLLSRNLDAPEWLYVYSHTLVFTSPYCFMFIYIRLWQICAHWTHHGWNGHGAINRIYFIRANETERNARTFGCLACSDT